MALVRFQPFTDEFPALQERFHRIFGDFPLSRFRDEDMGTWSPACDIIEIGDDIVVRSEIPGVSKDDIDVQVENNVLMIRGERKREKELKGENIYRSERFYGSFSRSFTLPVTVDVNNIKAEYRDGVLQVTLPKVEEAKPRKVKVLTV